MHQGYDILLYLIIHIIICLRFYLDVKKKVFAILLYASIFLHCLLNNGSPIIKGKLVSFKYPCLQPIDLVPQRSHISS